MTNFYFSLFVLVTHSSYLLYKCPVDTKAFWGTPLPLFHTMARESTDEVHFTLAPLTTPFCLLIKTSQALSNLPHPDPS